MTRYLFLDGGCLRARVAEVAKRYCAGADLKIDWRRPSHGYRKVFYYDALPTRKPKQSSEEFEAERQAIEDLHATLATLDRFRVNEGDTRYRKGRGLEQKKVDVMIAVDMMIHTIRRNMDEAALLAGDGDFTPLLNALSNEGMFVTLIHPPKASKELLAAADARSEISVRRVFEWVDEQSKGSFGRFPKVFYAPISNDANCQLIWSSDDDRNIRVWLQLVDNEIWASWSTAGRNDRLNLRGGSWLNTRLLAQDDFDVQLPNEPPPDFAHL